MELSILFPGSILFASPPTAPNILGTPGFIEKSSISLFRKNPAPATTTLLPYKPLSVVVTATAFPSLSITEICVVSVDSLGCGVILPTSELGVALFILKLFQRFFKYSSEISIEVLSVINPGSPINSARSAKARLSASTIICTASVELC